MCRLLAGSNRNYSGPRSGLAHDLHIRLKQYPRVSAAVGRFNVAGAPAESGGRICRLLRGQRGTDGKGNIERDMAMEGSKVVAVFDCFN